MTLDITTKHPNLRKQEKRARSVDDWTLENLRDGLLYFYELNGRYPTAPEIDNFDYLPSCRQIQRKFGGLEKLRALLGHDEINFGKGEYRSKIALTVNKRGRKVELELEKILKNKFGEVFVHTEKPFSDFRNRVDFYVFCPSGNFGIDIFDTDTIQNLQKNINIKLDKYISFNEQLYLVVANSQFKQETLDLYTVSKRKLLPENIKILTLESVILLINRLEPYPNPIIKN